jgi:predicted lipoprotein with Yx(FWY)xxD motif
LGSVLFVIAAFGAPAAVQVSSAAAASTAPVTLAGTVTNKGTQTASGNKISIAAHDYYFSPTFVKAKPGTTLTVTVTNVGKQEHTFTVPGQSVNATVKPGKTATVKVDVPADGAVLFLCNFHGPNGTDSDRGMQGAIYTQAGQTISNQAAATPTLKAATDAKYGKILVNADGMTLYQRDTDTSTSVTCTGACATIWPPVTVTDKAVVGTGINQSLLGTVAGANGTQITYAGHPLYRYSKDLAVGDTNGEGVAGVWWTLGTDGQKITAPAPATTAPPTTTPTNKTTQTTSGSGY